MNEQAEMFDNQTVDAVIEHWERLVNILKEELNLLTEERNALSADCADLRAENEHLNSMVVEGLHLLRLAESDADL